MNGRPFWIQSVIERCHQPQNSVNQICTGNMLKPVYGKGFNTRRHESTNTRTHRHTHTHARARREEQTQVGERRKTASYISVGTHGNTAEAFLALGRTGETAMLGLLNPAASPDLNGVIPARLGAGRPLAPRAHLTVDGWKQDKACSVSQPKNKQKHAAVCSCPSDSIHSVKIPSQIKYKQCSRQNSCALHFQPNGPKTNNQRK